MKQKKALVKLAQVRLAINHVLRQRMVKSATVDTYDKSALEREREDAAIPKPYQQYPRREDPYPYPLPPSLMGGPRKLQEEYNDAKVRLSTHRQGKMYPAMSDFERDWTNLGERIGAKMTGVVDSMTEPRPAIYKRYQDAKEALKAKPLYPLKENIEAVWNPRYQTLYDLNRRMQDASAVNNWDEWSSAYEQKKQLEEPLEPLEEQAQFADDAAQEYRERPASLATRDMFNRDYARWIKNTRKQLGLTPDQPLMTRMYVDAPDGRSVRSPITGRYRTYDYNAQFPPKDPFNENFSQEEWDYAYPKMKKQWDKQDKIDKGIQGLNRGIDKGLRRLYNSPVKTMLPTTIQTMLPFIRWGRQIERNSFPERWNSQSMRDGNWDIYR